MREYKFRIYSFISKSFIYFDIYDYPQGIAGGVREPQQYTGCHDSANKEIYEGDIVEVVWWFEPKTREQTKQELIINRGGVLKDRWAIINIHDNGIFYTPVFPELDDNHDDDEETNFDEFMAKSSEVIGNIYENPELIEP